VERNRIKRLLREAFRHEQHGLTEGFDFVCVPRAMSTSRLGDVRNSLVRVSARAVTRCKSAGK
jgi:ribonuclease P protein component